MDQRRFWSLIDLLGEKGVRGDLERLRAALVESGEPTISDFEEYLQSAVEALRTPAHKERNVSDLAHPAGADPIPMSDDALEYAALAVVSLGEATWNRVRNDPHQFDGRWPVADGEALLGVIGSAFETVTGGPWLPLGRPRPEPTNDDGRRTEPWLSLYGDFENLKDRPGVSWSHVRSQIKPYRAKLTWLGEQLVHRDKSTPGKWGFVPTVWSQWWEASQGTGSTLSCFFGFAPNTHPRSSLRTVGAGSDTETTATFVFDLSSIDGPPEVVGATARAHVFGALSQVAQKIQMPQPPELPMTRRERSTDSPGT